jgi:signal transduction histidine kinase
VDEISAATQHAVFRIVQEALSNIHRHAQATQVSVLLANRRSVLSICISDNGKGFVLAGEDPGEVSLGVGIVGMRARIEQLGGTLEIKARDVGGTRVSAEMPLPPALPGPADRARPPAALRADHIAKAHP